MTAIAAAAHEYQLVEYLRTAAQLGRLRSTWVERGAAVGETFVGDCEQVISVQDEAWMAKMGRCWSGRDLLGVIGNVSALFGWPSPAGANIRAALAGEPGVRRDIGRAASGPG